MTSFAGYRSAGAQESARANRSYWDSAAVEYLDEHGDFLAGDLIWGPEGTRESQVHLLGDVSGVRALEIGAGAAQGSAWLAQQGAQVVATDISTGMLRAGLTEHTPGAHQFPRLTADARQLPLAEASFDLAFTAYGAIPFVADPEVIMAEVARVLRPGGRWVFSCTHPIRWAFPDDPGPGGLTATRSYYDTQPYIEAQGSTLTYAEHHRTLSQRIRDVLNAGFLLRDLIEPEWTPGHTEIWGGWSPLRGQHFPGTLIVVAEKP